MEQCFVAFIDLLGFAEMVELDCNNPSQSFSTLKNLIDVVDSINSEVGSQRDVGFTQFSDSIVLSAPFDRSRFSNFICLCKNLQVLLLKKGILCRGGLAVGRHYAKSNFIFSEGLIEAYRIESTTARVPRIIVSDNLLQLVAYPENTLNVGNLILDKDHNKFIHYLNDIEPDILLSIAEMSLKKISGQISTSIREKHTWLLDYIAFSRPELKIKASLFEIVN